MAAELPLMLALTFNYYKKNYTAFKTKCMDPENNYNNNR